MKKYEADHIKLYYIALLANASGQASNASYKTAVLISISFRKYLLLVCYQTTIFASNDSNKWRWKLRKFSFLHLLYKFDLSSGPR